MIHRSVAFPQPTQTELGLDVTIAIVAMTMPADEFVQVSDRMVFHDDVVTAADDAIMKNFVLTPGWSVAFSADDLKHVLPIIVAVRARMQESKHVGDVKKFFSEVCANTIRDNFIDRRLRRYGYTSIDEFRRDGRENLGDKFFELCRELDEETTSASFIVYGYDTDQDRTAQLFEVSNKVEIIDRRLLRYAVVGSGYWLASASIRRKKMDFQFASTVYRLLEAKFSAEKATGIGTTTTLTIKQKTRPDIIIWQQTIEQVRHEWEAEMKRKDPETAIDIISKNKATIDNTPIQAPSL